MGGMGTGLGIGTGTGTGLGMGVGMGVGGMGMGTGGIGTGTGGMGNGQGCGGPHTMRITRTAPGRGVLGPQRTALAPSTVPKPHGAVCVLGVSWPAPWKAATPTSPERDCALPVTEVHPPNWHGLVVVVPRGARNAPPASAYRWPVLHVQPSVDIQTVPAAANKRGMAASLSRSLEMQQESNAPAHDCATSRPHLL